MRIPLELPPGLKSDDTAFASSPAWVDGSNVRFRLGRPQTIGGWESITTTLLTGVCRSAFPWTDNSNILNIAFGTNTNLQLYQGGLLYDITPAASFTPGAVDGTGTSGYGTGSYGSGQYGEPSASDYFPLTWSLAAYGQTLIACPRNQTIFQWSNNTGTPAAAVTNAPAQVTYALVSPQRQIFAIGCSQEVGGAFNPMCVRHSDVAGATGWTTDITSGSTSREYVLPGGGRLVAGRVMGKNLLIWSNYELFLGTYVGQLTQVWTFDKIGEKCGLIGPNAAVVVDQTAYWISPDRQFHSYTLGGPVLDVPCPIREDFANNLSASQGDKIVASSIAEFSEVRFDYPDSRDGYENSRYVAVNLPTLLTAPDNAWYRGKMARTAMVDAGPSDYPCGVTYGGAIYWHERGNSADGQPFAWSLTTASIYLNEDNAVLVRGFWPDIADQIGPVSFSISTRHYPQGDLTTYPTVMVAAGQATADFKAEGRLFTVTISGSSIPSRARLGRLVFDAKLRGKK